MIGDRERIARFHSDFFREKYRKMLRYLLVLCFLMLLLIGGIIYFILFNPEPAYYATTTQGQIIPLAKVVS